MRMYSLHCEGGDTPLSKVLMGVAQEYTQHDQQGGVWNTVFFVELLEKDARKESSQDEEHDCGAVEGLGCAWAQLVGRSGLGHWDCTKDNIKQVKLIDESYKKY